MNAIKITLPYPLSSNRYWRTLMLKGFKAPVTTLSREAKEYKAKVRQIVVSAGIEPIHGRVSVSVKLYPARPLDWQSRQRKEGVTWDDSVRCIDLDNANKVLLDSLKGVAIEDDKWVRRLHSERMEPDGGEARVVVTITPLIVVQPQVALFEFKPMEAAQWLG